MSRPETPLPGGSRPWKVRLLTAFGVLLVLVWAAPILVGYTPLVGWATSALEGQIDGKVQVGGVSLGWFTPIVLYDVVMRDAENRVLAHIPRVQGDRGLFKLLLDRSDLGSYRLDEATIDIHCQGGCSNLERVLARALRQPAAAKSTGAAKKLMPRLHLETVDAAMTIHDDDAKQGWSMQAISLSCRILDQGNSAQINLQGVLNDGSESGSLKLEVSAENLREPSVRATAKGQFTALPIALVNLVARRYQPGVELFGSLQGNFLVTAAFKDGKPNVQALGELVGNQITLRTPLLADTLRVLRLNAPFSVRLEDGKLSADRLEIESDFGKAAVQGSLDLNRDWPGALNQAGCALALDLNLAILAERLPKTMHLQRDVRLTGGQLQVRCKSLAGEGGVVWQGKLHTSDVRGIKSGQTIAWSEPLTLEFQARDLHKGIPIFDSLHCSARFLRIEGAQTAEQFTLTAEADLRQLAEPLSQFIDFDTVKLAGKASSRVVVRHSGKDQFTLQGSAEMQNTTFAWFTKQAWQEPLVTAKIDVRGSMDQAGKISIEQGNLELRMGSDAAAVQLTEPITDLAHGPWGALALRADGDLARWRERARSWTAALDDCQLAGLAKIQLQARVAAAAVECAGVNVQVSDLRFVGKNAWINEPSVTLTTNGRWDAKAGQLTLTQTKLNGAAVQADAPALTFTPAPMSLRGNANVRGDLARLQQWTRDPNVKPGEPVAGAFTGRVEIDTIGDRLVGGVNLIAKNVTYGPVANPTWQEAEVKCVVQGSFDLGTSGLTFDQLQIIGATFNVDAKGNVAHLTTTADLDLAGTLAYDLEKLEPQLRPILGKDVKIAGRDARAFEIAGALFPQGPGTAVPGLSAVALRFTELKGNANVHWEALHALGCDVGRVEVRAVLQKGWFQLFPVETTFNQGKLRLQPNIRLDPAPVEMILLAGTVIDKAQITPQMCAGALAYALPLLANVAEAEGTVSVALESGRLPLAAPTTGDLKGTITLHAGKLSPGPIVRELSGLLRVPPPTSLLKETKVPFQMSAGKVYHKDLELAFPDYTLKSSGAVGMDGSLALLIEMPIPPQLARALKLTPAQAKQTLRIPVGGTLEHPRPDPRALESLTAIVGRSLLENQLNRLLQPKR